MTSETTTTEQTLYYITTIKNGEEVHYYWNGSRGERCVYGWFNKGNPIYYRSLKKAFGEYLSKKYDNNGADENMRIKSVTFTTTVVETEPEVADISEFSEKEEWYAADWQKFLDSMRKNK